MIFCLARLYAFFDFCLILLLLFNFSFYVFRLLVCSFSSSLITWYFLDLLIPVLRRKLIDRPNCRSSHVLPTPRGGGVSFVVVSFICCLFALISDHFNPVSVLPLVATPLALIGLVDDRYSLPASWRYCIQLLTAGCVVYLSPVVQSLGSQLSSVPFLFVFLFSFLLLSVTAVINFINFMDGLDGLVAGCMVVSISTLGLLISSDLSTWALVGSLLGFLFWNWSPAKVFMGDVGSTFLGAIFAGLVLQASTWHQALGFLLLATPLLGDALICVLRRLVAGHCIFQAHRLHLFQRLHQAGWSHSRVSLLYVTATALLSLALLLGGLQWTVFLSLLTFIVGVWLDQKFAISFSASSSV